VSIGFTRPGRLEIIAQGFSARTERMRDKFISVASDLSVTHFTGEYPNAASEEPTRPYTATREAQPSWKARGGIASSRSVATEAEYAITIMRGNMSLGPDKRSRRARTRALPELHPRSGLEMLSGRISIRP